MNEHTFEIQVDGYDPAIRDDDLSAFGNLASKLTDLGDADMALALQNGAVLVDVWRDDCETAKSALLKTIRELKSIGLNAVRIAPDDLVTSAELAKRLGRTPANITQIAKGDRRKAKDSSTENFPAPIMSSGRKSQVFSYVKILKWIMAGQHGLLEDIEEELRKAEAIQTANSALGLVVSAVIAEERLEELIKG